MDTSDNEDNDTDDKLSEEKNPEDEAEETSDKNKQKKEEIKIIEYTLQNDNMNNGFINLFNVLNSVQTNADVKLMELQLRHELLNYILNRQVLIELNCK